MPTQLLTEDDIASIMRNREPVSEGTIRAIEAVLMAKIFGDCEPVAWKISKRVHNSDPVFTVVDPAGVLMSTYIPLYTRPQPSAEKPADHVWVKCPNGHGEIGHQHFDYCGMCPVCHQALARVDPPSAEEVRDAALEEAAMIASIECDKPKAIGDFDEGYDWAAENIRDKIRALKKNEAKS
jgi:hypothetical protein